jgi:hypothetical protein
LRLLGCGDERFAAAMTATLLASLSKRKQTDLKQKLDIHPTSLKANGDGVEMNEIFRSS